MFVSSSSSERFAANVISSAAAECRVRRLIEGNSPLTGNESPGIAGGFIVAGPSKGPDRDEEEHETRFDADCWLASLTSTRTVGPLPVTMLQRRKSQLQQTSNCYCLPGRAGGLLCLARRSVLHVLHVHPVHLHSCVLYLRSNIGGSNTSTSPRGSHAL